MYILVASLCAPRLARVRRRSWKAGRWRVAGHTYAADEPRKATGSCSFGCLRISYLVADRIGVNWQAITGMQRSRDLFQLFDVDCTGVHRVPAQFTVCGKGWGFLRCRERFNFVQAEIGIDRWMDTCWMQQQRVTDG